MLISLPLDQGLNHGFYQHPEAFTSRLRKESFHSPLRDLKLQLGHWFPFVGGCFDTSNLLEPVAPLLPGRLRRPGGRTYRRNFTQPSWREV